MIALDAKFEGVAGLNSYLRRVERKVKEPRKMNAEIAAYIFGAFQKNMAKGVDPTGKPLAPVARWTRLIGKSSGGGKGRTTGKLIPLLNTGSLRNAMNIFGLSDKGVTIGWKGKFLDIATRITNGTRGNIQLRQKGIKGYYTGIKTSKEGNQYFAVNADGRWFSRRAKDGTTPVKPRARKFFYLSREQIKRSTEIADKYISRAISK